MPSYTEPFPTYSGVPPPLRLQPISLWSLIALSTLVATQSTTTQSNLLSISPQTCARHRPPSIEFAFPCRRAIPCACEEDALLHAGDTASRAIEPVPPSASGEAGFRAQRQPLRHGKRTTKKAALATASDLMG